MRKNKYLSLSQLRVTKQKNLKKIIRKHKLLLTRKYFWRTPICHTVGVTIYWFHFSQFVSTEPYRTCSFLVAWCKSSIWYLWLSRLKWWIVGYKAVKLFKDINGKYLEAVITKVVLGTSCLQKSIIKLPSNVSHLFTSLSSLFFDVKIR